MLQLKRCFPCRSRSLAMSSGYQIAIFSVNNSTINLCSVAFRKQENGKQITAALNIVKGTKTVFTPVLPPQKQTKTGIGR